MDKSSDKPKGPVKATKTDPKKFAKFKKILLEERQRVINSSFKSLDDIKLSTDDLSDETDHAVSELNQNLAFSLRDRERTLLASINAALERIENGTFGVCESCDDEIEPKRLEARPMTTVCFACKEEQERKEKIFA